MRRKVLIFRVTGLLFLLFISVMLTTCVENKMTLYIVQNQAPADPPECLVTNETDSPFHSFGTIDLTIRETYIFHALIENQLIETRDDLLQAESNNIIIEGARVRIFYQSTEGEPAAEFFSWSTCIVPASGYGITSFNILPSSVADNLRSQLSQDGAPKYYLIIVGIKLYGTTTGAMDVESPEFYYPIYVFSNSYISCPNDAIDPDTGVIDCSTTVDSVCTPGQDAPLDVRARCCMSDDPVSCAEYYCANPAN